MVVVVSHARYAQMVTPGPAGAIGHWGGHLLAFMKMLCIIFIGGKENVQSKRYDLPGI